MGIDMAMAEEIKQKLSQEGRDLTHYKPVSLSALLRERFQTAADAEMGGDFSHMLEAVMRLYLADPAKFPVCWVKINEGTSKNKPMTLSVTLINEIQERANALTDGKFARLVQIVIRGYLVDRGYLTIPQ